MDREKVVGIRTLLGLKKSPRIEPGLDDPDAYYKEERRNYEKNLVHMMDDRYMRSPRTLSIETYVKCNATCEFCPYPTSTRIGQKLETEIIYKIIDDVSASDVPPQYFVPARINEPMFDHRMYAIFDYAATKLPRTPIGHFTNGTTLSARHIDKLCSMPNLGFINVSLNAHDADDHRRLMGINFDLVIKNLTELHRVYAARGLVFPVNLTRVGDGTSRDTGFLVWCRSHFPLFHASCRPRFDWLGKTYAMEGRAPPGCGQWFDLNFLANGREALCCIDDDGTFGKGDAHDSNALDIYNHPTRLALREKKDRSLHPACAACNALI